MSHCNRSARLSRSAMLLVCDASALREIKLGAEKTEGNEKGRAFATFYKHKLMSHWELANKHSSPSSLCLCQEKVRLMLQLGMFTSLPEQGRPGVF